MLIKQAGKEIDITIKDNVYPYTDVTLKSNGQISKVKYLSAFTFGQPLDEELGQIIIDGVQNDVKLAKLDYKEFCEVNKLPDNDFATEYYKVCQETKKNLKI